MNRTKIKNFATLARKELHEQTEARLQGFGITRKGIETAKDITGGLVIGGKTVNLSSQEKAQYQDLIKHVAQHGFEATVTEIAYTWFNRLSALRYMEVNGLMDHVLSSSTSGAYPDLLEHADTLIAGGEFDGISVQDLEEWRGLNLPNTEEFIYRRLLGARIRQLAKGLPSIFDSGEKPHLELFMPPNLLHTDSLLRKLVSDIPEEDWRDIEVIGWLYQFYISDKKDQVIGAKSKVKAEDIPAATQLFTPHWIVRYMVENSLGRLWLEHHPESQLRTVMPYFLENPEQPLDVRNEVLTPQELKVLDPACGSGHILVYAFDLLFEIYREQGYPERDIPKMILEHNLYGLDIDERAAQLASFALVMKAAQKNRRILRNPPEVNVLQVKPTRFSPLFGAQAPARPAVQGALGFGSAPEKDQSLFSGAINPVNWQPLLYAFKDADNLGSLITPPEDVNYPLLHEQVQRLEQERGLGSDLLPELKHYLKQADILRFKYHAVVANPPYMGNRNLNDTVKSYLESNFKEAKADLFSSFILKCCSLTSIKGHLGFTTPYVWMFISSYENLRNVLLTTKTITTLVQLEYNSSFENARVPVCVFTIKNMKTPNYKGSYIKLSDFYGFDIQGLKTLEAVKDESCSYRYKITAEELLSIPGSPIAYWLSKKMIDVFSSSERISNLSETKKGMGIGNNDRFVREWFEISEHTMFINCQTRIENIESKKKWFPYNNGGDFRKWYGNNETLVNWYNDGEEAKENATRKNNGGHWSRYLVSLNFFFLPSVTWSAITSGKFSSRASRGGALFSSAGMCLFGDRRHEVMALLNSNVGQAFLNALSPTLNFGAGEIGRVPFVYHQSFNLSNLIDSAIHISKTDWDNFETSWDFQTHPLLRSSHPRIKDAFSEWEKLSSDAFYELKRLEEENNRYWIDAYGLQDELTPEVPEEQITIRKADLGRDVKSLLSYAVGCMMGRYSLDTPGLVHAGQPFDPGKHQKFPADADAILPVTTEAYFQDDLVTRFQEFLKVAYGPDRLSENLEFVADALGRKGNESALQTIRRYFVTEFASDHIQTYKKRPIYWLFTSGKRRAFNAFVYLHRYTPDTLARLRTDYVLELQTRLDAQLSLAEAEAASSSGAQKRNAETRIKNLKLDIEEVRAYQLKVQQYADQRIALDLDDGVAYNYTRFKGIVYEGTDLKMADLEKKAQWKMDLLKEQGLG
ncbi:BREX-1 system adenine-specific DNA-methyltransferase PglX [Deinococcus cellulosilyticus]|uniref:site-specific DNA-methyltransferase (adenine-specific) n=1 Tax=Deinococcus cellulosilyticus (strain DSM 18568 / NBRC 106333 / KACC 11606 / 5516J-15) TaxID=1223518 RepID=A0A511N8J4_DEIC1|nr:BREX-1 system adenine-specific DNA-methyltransferase PglX [Deinococcus cellulosilyticus]GEM49169.1 class I SAM-dependent DNA methyltransferase [Deinococcus cellulosilyticus NBRC 106333 = KACC 11606]